ncbi:hypothetical protein DB88DRAFT_476226 [Papiliotrema laurentii]|uniref:Arf-GAP domain-containing protein n=1 Tax=Papiliotrema laurentii TaxID=5418 RepID=A0AAD9L8H1_PAPLA|nr:hypothetical protein DB88DRAFT_476226 [Papiliotrema laurentii]
MSRQDKATTDRHARILRDLVKQPDNKACADCRKNDARWASWNLGVFLCIRCSGIHRSMGTHISKVKSIDLDMWTPEQMESIQKWGNRRANLYWEKHLKAGHVPPDHKIESFIRSKYESKRWAMDGPPPSDPSVLETGGSGPAPAAPAAAPTRPTPTATAPAPSAARAAHPLLSRATAAAKAAPAPTPAPVIDLFGEDESTPVAQTASAPPAANTTAESAPPAQTAAQPTPAPGSNIFDLDFRAPTPQTHKPQTAKADIMSLFSAASPPAAAPTQSFFSAPPPPAQTNFGSWGGGITSSAPPTMQTPHQAPISNGGGWGGIQMDQNAWGAPAASQTQQPHPPAQAQNNLWGQGSNDPWASGNTTGASAGGGFGGFDQPTAKKEEVDPFANIWK